MTRSRGIALAVAGGAVVLALALFLLLRGGEDGPAVTSLAIQVPTSSGGPSGRTPVSETRTP